MVQCELLHDSSIQGADGKVDELGGFSPSGRAGGPSRRLWGRRRRRGEWALPPMRSATSSAPARTARRATTVIDSELERIMSSPEGEGIVARLPPQRERGLLPYFPPPSPEGEGIVVFLPKSRIGRKTNLDDGLSLAVVTLVSARCPNHTNRRYPSTEPRFQTTKRTNISSICGTHFISR